MKELIPQSKLDFWVKHDINVMLEGMHGIGKTHIVLDVAKRHNLKLQYFSCATLDPWVDFIGIPKQKKDKETGKYYLDLIRPKVFAFDQVQFIFLDELNRADPKVHNAVMELIQFRSINGKRFKNLKMIWAAINPPGQQIGGANFAVQELDPALQSRFNVRIQLPFDIADDYMKQKYGPDIAKAIGPWWRALSPEVKVAFPPRAVDYAIDYMKKGGDVADCIPKAVNKTEFVRVVNGTYSNKDDFDLSEDTITIEQVQDRLTTAHLKELRTTSSVVRARAIIALIRQTRNPDLVPFMSGDHSHKATLLASCSPTQLSFLYSRSGTAPSLSKSEYLKHYTSAFPSIVIDRTADQIIGKAKLAAVKKNRYADDDQDYEEDDEDDEQYPIKEIKKAIKQLK